MSNSNINHVNPISGVNESEVSENNRKFPIPKFSNAFPVRRNPLHDSPLIEDWVKWAYDYSGMSLQQYKKIQGIGLFCAYFFPFCSDMKRYENLIKYWIMLFVLDDQSECNYGDPATKEERSMKIWTDIRDGFKKLSTDEFIATNRWPVYVYGQFAPLEEIYHSYNPVQRKRMVDVWNQAIIGCIEEVKYLAEGKIKSLDEFLKIRMKNAGTALSIQMIEYSDNIFVPEHVWENVRFQKVLELAGKQILCANDVLSFEKEFNDQDKILAKTFNMVAIISHLDEVSIEQAMFKAIDMMRQFERELFAIEDQIQNDKDCLPVTKKFIEKINYLLGGNTCCHFRLDRYNKLEDNQSS